VKCFGLCSVIVAKRGFLAFFVLAMFCMAKDKKKLGLTSCLGFNYRREDCG